MADTVTCLDITEEAVTAVRVERQSRALVIMECGTVSLHDISLEEGLARLGRKIDLSGEGQLRLSLGMEFFSFRNLVLPFVDRKKISQVLPFELETLSALEPGRLHTDFLISGMKGEGASIVTATLEKDFFSGMLTACETAGFDSDLVEIRCGRVALHLADMLQGDCLLLDRYGSRVGLTFVRNGKISLVRGLSLGLSGRENGEGEPGKNFVWQVKQTLLGAGPVDEENSFTICFLGKRDDLAEALEEIADFFDAEIKIYRLSDQPLVKINPSLRDQYRDEVMDGAFSLAAKEAGKNLLFNFRRGEFKKSKNQAPLQQIYKKTAVLLLICVVLAGGYLGYDYRVTLKRQKELKEQIVSVFKETLPHVKRIVNPVRQLQAEINELKKTYKNNEFRSGYGIVPLLTEISARIPRSYSVTVKRMIIDADMVRMRGVTSDFNTVDNIQKELEKSKFFHDVVISSASQTTDGDGVRFELKLNLFQQDR